MVDSRRLPPGAGSVRNSPPMSGAAASSGIAVAASGVVNFYVVRSPSRDEVERGLGFCSGSRK